MRLKSFVVAIALGASPFLATAHSGASADDDGVAFSPELAMLQVGLHGTGVRLESAQVIWSSGWDGASPHTLIANDRTHVLSSQFVENDPRRDSPPNTITYLVDASDGAALAWNPTNTGVFVVPNAFTEPLLDLSMAAWADYQCNGPAVAKIADDGSDPDLVDGLVQPEIYTVGTPRADITHAGWLPAAFFNALVPGGGSSILGATFTFIFVDDDGNPTDVDHNGRADVAFREIYYNRNFGWLDGTGSERNIDIPSVAIHEAGHGFGLAHFGKITLKADGRIQRSPAAIMNAAYLEPDREIRGTDTASFCQIWANPR